MTRAEFQDGFAKWYDQWSPEKGSALDEEKLRNGLNTILARGGNGARGGFGGQGGRRGPGGGGMGGGVRVNGVERRHIEYSDSSRLADILPGIKFTTFGTRAAFLGGAGSSNVAVANGNRVESLIVRGAEPDYPDAIPLFSVAQGRFISRYDEEHARPVAVLGADVADALFPHLDPIGQSVRVNGKLYDVIGVFARDPGMFGGPGVDQFAVIPLSEFRKSYPESKELIIAFSIPKDMDPGRAQDDVASAARRVRRVRTGADNDFEITSPDFLSTLWNQLTGALVMLTGAISSVGLLVGGIGVMNIMLISVTERTNEIGVRKAIGARKSDIRVQFLLEAVLLTSIGGVIGILLGAVVAAVVRAVAPSVPATLSYLWITLGVGISLAVGIFFGYYPANRAANLDPIVCLRYE
ncbi:MAG: ABC transporter permease [Acidobacteria bacterium]|nr:ABC transporter permease [Acidobacteriota bacterium]